MGVRADNNDVTMSLRHSLVQLAKDNYNAEKS